MRMQTNELKDRKPKNNVMNSRFLKKYSSALLSVSNTLNQERPDYILALSRKGPRLLELLRLSGMWSGDIPIISEKAIDFIPPNELKGKKIVVFDDIIISGSTIENLISNVTKKYDAEIKILCLAIDKDTIALPHDRQGSYWIEISLNNNEKKRISIDYKLSLNRDERFIFCNEIVRSFVFLNKSYDVDYPIFYVSIDSESMASLLNQSKTDKAYNLTTVYQHNNGFRRYTFLPTKNVIISNLFNNFFQDCYLHPQICKVRIYYNEETKQIALVPMVTFEIDARLLEEEQIFAKFQYYNELIDEARYLIEQSKDFIEFKDARRPLYRLVWYLVSYIYGLSFSIRNFTEKNNFLSFVPSQILQHQDLIYLFGPSLTKSILDFLDMYYSQTISELKNLSKIQIDLPDQKNKMEFSDSKVHVPFDKERKKLYEDIKIYLLDHIQPNDALTNQMAAIFEGLYYCKEIPTQEDALKYGIKEDYYKRLKKGFSYDQIKWILHRHGALSESNENEVKIKISLALDFLVDAGIQIPIFYYERDDGFFERAYRYGEDALSAEQYGYTIMSVTKDLFDYMKAFHSRNILPKISFEKIGVILQEDIATSGNIDILKYLPDPNDRKLIISPAYSRHGKILHISDEKYERSNQYPFMFTGWCEREGIIQVMKGGVTYNDSYYNKIKFKGDEHVPKLVPDNFIAGLKRLATLLYHVDRCADKNKQSDFLIALTTCGDHESYLEALREELKLFFDSPEYAFSIPLGRTTNYLENRKKHTVKELEEILALLSQKSYSAAHGIRHKKQLWDDFYRIIEEIETYFYNSDWDIRFAYEEKLKPLIELKKNTHDLPMEQPFEVVEKLKLIGLGELCIRLSTILKNLLELVIMVHKLRRTKSGEIHKTDLKAISNKTHDFYKSIGQWNSEIEKQLAKNLSEYHIKGLRKIDTPYFIFSEYNSEECRQLMKKIVPKVHNNYKKLEMIYNNNFSFHKWEVKRMKFNKRYSESLIEIEGMIKAIEISEKCKSEDENVHPKVGAVVIKDNKIICTAYRGELKDGEHAEYTALIRKCGDMDLRDATLITTLEPCTARKHDKKPCALHIVDKGIKRVLIGMIDPNPEIRGKGMLFLQRKGIEVALFPKDLQDRVKEINKEFWDKEWKKYKFDLMKETTETEWNESEDEIKKDFDSSEIHIPKIFELLNKKLTIEEVRTLCEIYLNIDFDNLEGTTKFSKITSIIRDFKRENNIQKLLDAIKQFKPKIWRDLWGDD